MAVQLLFYSQFDSLWLSTFWHRLCYR